MSRSFKSLTFNGNDLYAGCGLIIQTKTAFSAPARDVTSQAVPGRSGNLLLDNGRYQNRTQKYTCVLASWFTEEQSDLAAVARRLKGFLLKDSSYLPLRDDYTPGYFYRASYQSALDVEEILPQVGKVSLQFDCEPFAFSDAGQEPITATASPAIIINPEEYDAHPKIIINGSGNVDITIANGSGNRAYHLTAIASGAVIDSELMEVFQGTDSCNSKMLTPDFPVLSPGENIIQWSGNVQSLQIIPRWCCL